MNSEDSICFRRLDFFMKKAIEQAQKALLNGDVPVGCLVVMKDEIVSSAYNFSSNPIMHAEILSISSAIQKIGKFDIRNCELFVTHEPCEMCYSAAVLAKIPRIFFGTYNDDNRVVKESLEYYGGLKKSYSEFLLKKFFTDKRRENGY